MSGNPLFQLRSELSHSNEDADGPSVTESFVEQFQSTHNIEPSISEKFTNEVILTENEKYTVSRLPPSLDFVPVATEVNGLVDTRSGNALVNDSDNLYIWPYSSTQREPPLTRVPLHEGHVSLSCTPKVVFTWPAAMDDENAVRSSGVLIVNKKSGLVQFYEDVDTINNLSSLLSKSKCHELYIKIKDKEVVTDVVNCEPAGILISTSYGRVLFLTIRDYMGKPHLKLKAQLLKSYFAFLFSGNKFKNVVSIKPGQILGKGERLVTILTSGGDFQIWNLSAVSNCYKTLEINLYDQILDSLQELYPFAHSSLLLLDSHPFSDDGSAHMILSSITNYDGARYYILTTFKLDEETNSFSIFSTYRLNTYTSSHSEDQIPRLLIPLSTDDASNDASRRAVTSVYTIFNHALVLTQVSSRLDQNYQLKRKWEDIICFRDDVQIIGYGKDAQSVYLVSNTMGVLTITASKSCDTNNQDEPRFIKSHIQQAVYFSCLPSSPIDFDLPKDITLQRDEIEEDLLATSKEILLSKSMYIPPQLKSLERHISMRIDLYRSLLEFTKSNFLHKVSPCVKIQLIESFEIMSAASQLLSYTRKSQKLNEIWQSVLNHNGISEDDFFKYKLDQFPSIFPQFLEELCNAISANSNHELWSLISEIVISCLFKGTLENGEEFYRFGIFEMDKFELNDCLPWYVQRRCPEVINTVFFGLSEWAKKSENESQHADQLLYLAKTLYYMCSQASLWLEQNPSQVIINENGNISKLYESYSSKWSQTLCDFDRKFEALRITEFYEDLSSLAEALNGLPEETSAELYTQYFEKFGYRFAEQLFSNYIAHGRLQELYEKFSSQKEYLKQFFEQNPHFSGVGWMGKIFDKQYRDASRILTEISTGEGREPRKLDTDQTRLSIAKLCTLNDEQALDFDRLTSIQAELDVIDGQKDIATIIDNGAKLQSRFESSSAIQKLYENLRQKILSSVRLTLFEVVEMYTLLQNKDCYYRALKLLSLERVCLNFETVKFLSMMIWRRCILFDDWSKDIDITDSALFHTLKLSFDDQIYTGAHFLLPSLNMLRDKSMMATEYYSSAYSSDIVDGNSILEFAAQEQKLIEKLGDKFDSKIKHVIAASNDSSDCPCVINYDTNEIEIPS